MCFICHLQVVRHGTIAYINAKVVLTIVSGILFARFSTVEHIPTIWGSLYDVINCKRKKLKRKSTLYTALNACMVRRIDSYWFVANKCNFWERV